MLKQVGRAVKIFANMADVIIDLIYRYKAAHNIFVLMQVMVCR